MMTVRFVARWHGDLVCAECGAVLLEEAGDFQPCLELAEAHARDHGVGVIGDSAKIIALEHEPGSPMLEFELWHKGKSPVAI